MFYESRKCEERSRGAFRPVRYLTVLALSEVHHFYCAVVTFFTALFPQILLILNFDKKR